MGSIVVSFANHFLWFFYFSNKSKEMRHRSQRYYRGPGEYFAQEPPTFAETATFFAVCVWLVPLFLFLSLSANDDTLPVAAGKDCFRGLVYVTN